MLIKTSSLDPNTHDSFSLLDEENLIASAIVYPGSTEQVQIVVEWANKHRIPIYPISMGRNRGFPRKYNVTS